MDDTARRQRGKTGLDGSQRFGVGDEHVADSHYERATGRGTTYQLKGDGKLVGKRYTGIGQLEVVPQFVQDKFGVRLTHVIILATPETQMAVDYAGGDPEKTYDRITGLYKDRLNLEAAGHPLMMQGPSADEPSGVLR